MVGEGALGLLSGLEAWAKSESAILSAVLFGSTVRSGDRAADQWSDIDLHLIVRDSASIESADWNAVIPGMRMSLKATRRATGGVRKMTVLFAEGEMDLVLVPEAEAINARVALLAGQHANSVALSEALNTLATILGGGYRFVKGEAEWGKFYATVAALPGYRIGDADARRLADELLIDAFWVFQKIARGELIAAQRMIHRALVETNVVLLHELRVRKSRETYQQARRAEMLAAPDELRAISINSRLLPDDLQRATWSCIEGLEFLMAELRCEWQLTDDVRCLLSRYAARPTPER